MSRSILTNPMPVNVRPTLARWGQAGGGAKSSWKDMRSADLESCSSQESIRGSGPEGCIGATESRRFRHVQVRRRGKVVPIPHAGCHQHHEASESPGAFHPGLLRKWKEKGFVQRRFRRYYPLSGRPMPIRARPKGPVPALGVTVAPSASRPAGGAAKRVGRARGPPWRRR